MVRLGRANRGAKESLDLYLSEINRFPLLSFDESSFYLRFIQDYLRNNQDVLAAEGATESNQKIVTKKVTRFREAFTGVNGILRKENRAPMTDYELAYAVRYLNSKLHRREDYSRILIPSSPDEAKELFLDLPSHDHRYSAAFSKIWSSNLRLVIPFAKKRYLREGRTTLEEKISFGNMGLKRAILKFDVELGFAFSTYAGDWIVQSIKEGILNESNEIRIPRSYKENLKKSKKLSDEEKERRKALPPKQPVSLSDPLPSSNSDGNSLLETIGDERSEDFIVGLYSREDLLSLRKLLDNGLLSEKEKAVVSYCFGLGGSPKAGEGMALKEIGKILGVGGERIRQIRNRALVKLRRKLDRRAG